jgi:hypothetical protein
MARAFKLKRNDLSRSLIWRPDNFTSAQALGAAAVFNMKDGAAAVKISRGTATISEDTTGVYFQYDWSGTDTDTAGTFYGEFEVTLASGKPETHPNEDEIDIVIREDIA